MSFLFLVLQLVYLLVPAAFANMAPPLTKPLLSRLAQSPIDGGLKFRGRPVLGSHKTWGGTLMGILAGILAAFIQHLLSPSFSMLELVDYSDWAVIGLLLGAGAIIGDLVKSFLKRQLNIKPGQTWVPFDELDFIIGALVFLSPYYFAGWINTFLILAVAFIGHILINLIGFYLHIRKRNEIVTLKYRGLTEEFFKKEGRLVVGTFFIFLSLLVKRAYGMEAYRDLLYYLLFINLLIDYLRAGLKLKIPLYSSWGRTNFEHESIHPVTFYLLGLIVANQFVRFDLVMASLCMFIYGDSAAAIFGKGFGKLKLFRNKTLEGSVAMLVFSILTGAFFIGNVAFIFALALFATVIELFLVRLPDAMIIPLAVALFGKLVEGRLF